MSPPSNKIKSKYTPTHIKQNIIRIQNGSGAAPQAIPPLAAVCHRLPCEASGHLRTPQLQLQNLIDPKRH
ncbi:unnamed protein product [Lactuca virosa]|uniref:Uncharacterized protein n=1 Tax=Lactuca virosa TaxID=75947 RepID=A0AAU9N4P7_9ASTR|nr:unnamed protein product [Lactuca virosa]